MWIKRAIQICATVSAAAGLLAGATASSASAQEEQKLTFELNKVEDVDGACHGSFVVNNKLGSPIQQLTLDLYLFDAQGIISQHTVLDIGPIPNRKTRILTFSLINDLCENINKIVINDIPNCRTSDGTTIDCLAASKAWTKGKVGFGL